ncbi:hypothetical protein [Stackebrandtia soli]|uniref:hypothetical protein n=1 Tax=Stackebrandtia soli TaxID=1892856 RepID=UPI0039E9EC7B
MDARAWVGGSIVSMRDSGDGRIEITVVHIDQDERETARTTPDAVVPAAEPLAPVG